LTRPIFYHNPRGFWLAYDEEKKNDFAGSQQSAIAAFFSSLRRDNRIWYHICASILTFEE
jgi:hypothetical protein